MAKGRDRPNREAKKPKANKKPAQAATPFLRAQQPAPPPKPKDTGK